MFPADVCSSCASSGAVTLTCHRSHRPAPRIRYGDGSSRPCAIRIHDQALERHLVVRSAAGASARLHGRPAQMVEGRIYDFLELLLINEQSGIANWRGEVEETVGRSALACPPSDAVQSAGPGAAQRGAPLRHRRRHLRPLPRRDRQYSCAYFSNDGAALEEAQLAKKRHLAAKLAIEPGPARARHRLRLGRPRRCILAPRTAVRRDRRHAQHRAAQDLARARRQGRA